VARLADASILQLCMTCRAGTNVISPRAPNPDCVELLVSEFGEEHIHYLVKVECSLGLLFCVTRAACRPPHPRPRPAEAQCL